MLSSGQKKRKVFSNVEIIDTADEGLSIGRCDDGLIIQVRGAVPGDRIDAVVVEKRKGMFIAKVQHIHQLSSDRTDPFCSHFGVCGGCKWQHMTYAAQLKFKEKKVHDAFRRIGGLDTGVIKAIEGSPLQTYYRNKMEFTASDRKWLTTEEMQLNDPTIDKNGIGFHLVGAFDKVLDIQHCYLQADPSNEIRHFIKNYCKDHQWTFSNVKYKTGYLRNVIIRNNIDGKCMVVIVVGADEPGRIKALVSALTNAFPAIVSVYSCVNPKVNDSINDLHATHEFGDEVLTERLGEVVYGIGPKSFFQTNSYQAVTLYSIAKELADLKPSDNVFDLYCGVGSLGLFMADRCRKVVGIEIIPEAIDDARSNAAMNGITNIEFAVGQVEALLDPLFIATYGKPDVILTDPPRAGMHPDVVKHLLAAGAEKIVYVSCNPATQARDIKLLSSDYDLISAVPVDMFPHTHHIESVALLRKK